MKLLTENIIREFLLDTDSPDIICIPHDLYNEDMKLIKRLGPLSLVKTYNVSRNAKPYMSKISFI
jgi:hypothetical protein